MPAPSHSAASRYVLPGGRFAAVRARDLPRLVAGLASLLGPRAWMTTAGRSVRNAERNRAAAAMRWLDLTVEVSGLHHIDPGRSYIVAPLHEGFADAVALIHCIPLELRFVARDELAAWPVLGRALRAGDHPTVTPESATGAYRRMLRTAPAILEGGESLVVFPQGSVLGIETAFSAGAFRLAAATQRPLLPIVLSGSHRVWDHPFDPTVRFGQRMSVSVLPAVEPNKAVAAQRPLEQAMKRLALKGPISPRRFVPERDGWWDGYAFSIDPDFSELASRVRRHRNPGGTRRSAA